MGQVAAAIYKYDPISGDTIFCKYLVKDGWTRFKQGKLTHDGNYIFIGRTDEFDPAGGYYVVKQIPLATFCGRGAMVRPTMTMA